MHSEARIASEVLCAAAEAMSADRGDMHMGVIWGAGGRRSTVHQRRSCPDWVFDRVRAYAQVGVVVWGGDHWPAAAAAWPYCSVVAAS
jgi:hypothetical protein